MPSSVLKDIEILVQKFYAEGADSMNKHSDRVSLSVPSFGAREAMRAIKSILAGWISQGRQVGEFERNFASYMNRSHGIAVNSGSSANLVALLALKERYALQDGDEVIVPASTFATVAMPIIQAGLVPVYVDVDRKTLNLNPEMIPDAISRRTRLIMPVHTLGYPVDMERIGELAQRYNLLVFEDCCEAHGSTLRGRKVGTFGIIASFSYFVAHNMTTGEGGMIVTDDDLLEVICRSLREFGRIDQRGIQNERYYSDDRLADYDRRYVFNRLGFNFRMTDVVAAFGIEQLTKLDDMNEKRRRNAVMLKSLLEKQTKDWLYLPNEEPGYVHTYYTFPLVLSEYAQVSRREFCEYLETHDIETRPLFAGCLPDQPAFRSKPGRVIGDLTDARFLRDRAVFVGIHPGLAERHLRHMAKTILAFADERIRSNKTQLSKR